MDLRGHDMRQWVPLMAMLLSAVGLLVGLGYCQPSGSAETIANARIEHARLEAQTEAKAKLLTERLEAIDAANSKEHEIFRQDIKTLTEKFYAAQVDAQRGYNQILIELRNAGTAPSAPKFHNGKRIDP